MDMVKVSVTGGWLTLACPCGEVWMAPTDHPPAVGRWTLHAVAHVGSCKKKADPGQIRAENAPDSWCA